MANGEITPGELRARFDLATLDPSEVELPGVGTTGGVARGGGILWSSLVAAAAQNVIQEIESTFTPTADISTQVADRAGQGFYDAAGLHVSNSTTAGDFTLVASLGGGGSGDLLAANNLSDLIDAVLARANLGLGTAATQASTAFEASGAVAAHAAAADPHPTYTTEAEVNALIAAAPGGSGDLLSTNNLSDLVDAAQGRTNLGLGTAAVEDLAAFDPAGSAATVQTNLDTHAVDTDIHVEVAEKAIIDQLVGTAGNEQYYGTDASGAKGYHDFAATNASPFVFLTDAQINALTAATSQENVMYVSTDTGFRGFYDPTLDNNNGGVFLR